MTRENASVEAKVNRPMTDEERQAYREQIARSRAASGRQSLYYLLVFVAVVVIACKFVARSIDHPEIVGDFIFGIPAILLAVAFIGGLMWLLSSD